MWMKYFKTKAQTEETLLDWVEIIKIRVLSGLTLHQALQDAPPLQSSKDICCLWKKLYHRVTEQGILSPADALQILEQRLKLHQSLTQFQKKKLSTPRMQNTIITCLTLFFFLISQCLLPNELSPSLFVLILVAGLIFGAQIWSQSILRALEKSMWFSEWVLALYRMESSVQSGTTFRQAFSDALQDLNPQQWPKNLLLTLESFHQSLRQGHEIEFLLASEQKGMARKVYDQISLLYRQVQRGVELSPTLRHFRINNFESLELHMLQKIEGAQWQLMLPLFCCLMPAFFILLFGPLLVSLQNN